MVWSLGLLSTGHDRLINSQRARERDLSHGSVVLADSPGSGPWFRVFRVSDWYQYCRFFADIWA